MQKKSDAFKKSVPLINCISKTSRVQIDNAEDLDVAMPMYALLEYALQKNDRKFVELLQR